MASLAHFYTNVDRHRNNLLIRGYKNGSRFAERVRYKPYLFRETKDDSKYKTLEGKNVEKIEFESMSEARAYIQNYGNVCNLYGLTSWPYTYIYDKFGTNIKYDFSMLKIGSLDIEVEVGGEIGNAFPQVTDAVNPVTAITIVTKNLKIVFGLKEFDTKGDSSIKYFRCRSEADLLTKFLEVWVKLDLDILTGYNINMFDCPYLVNRITNVLGKDEAEKLSPWRVLEWRKVETMGRTFMFVRYVGMEILDYIELYKKFNPGGRESFKLDYIANYELGEQKLDYSEYSSLYELYQKNYQKYIDYNIHDAVLVQRLNAKQRLIELAVSIAYSSGVNYSDSLGTVKLWDIIIHGYLRNKNTVIPHVDTASAKANHTGIEGAYVKDPKPAGYDWVESFDVTSLYPSLFMQANISPETLLKRGIHNSDDIARSEYSPVNILNGSLRKPDIQQKLTQANAGICAGGAIFANDVEGFIPALIKERFDLRQSYKKKMKTAEKELELIKAEMARRGMKE